MKLKTINIEHYKNLKNEFSFEQNNGYISLIGLNGSGKSNLLEAISLIFSRLIGINAQQPFPRFSLSYDIREHEINISDVDSDASKLNDNDLPASVIACYSGEDNRLWNSGFKDYYIKFFNAAIRGGEYKPRLLYINKYCWKIAFVSLLFSENENVKNFISDKLHINKEMVKVKFRTKDGANPQPHEASNWYKRVENKYGDSEINILELMNDEEVDLHCTKYPTLTLDQIVFYYLYFLHMPDKKGTLGLEADKVIENIELIVNGYHFEDLSEGEKKLILIECITKVLGDKDSLVLLDEPDAHTHIAMKKDLLKLISEFEGQTVMTTHSPMFLNKRWEGYDDKNIYYMNDGQIENTEPLQHLAELTGDEIDYFEGSFILSSKRILVTEGPYDILYIKHAIDKLSADNQSYLKIIEQVAFLHAGGSDNAVDLYNQTLYPSRNHYEHLVFLFDYDKAGFEGAEKVKKAINDYEDTKPVILFYQNDYSTKKDTKPNDKDPESYIVEDLFDFRSYSAVTNKIHVNSHKELRNITWNGVISGNKRPKATTEAIKYYIQENYKTFEKEWLLNFKPVLDKLLEVFQLY